MSKAGDRAKNIIHVYYHKRKAYELKSSLDYRAQKQLFARRRKAENATAEATK